MRVNAPKLGQMRSIDALYASVQTPYVVHLEDDWKFSGGVDLDKVVRFLEARPDVSVVCIGYRLDERFKQCARKTTQDGIDYWVWDLDAHPKWFSFDLILAVSIAELPVSFREGKADSQTANGRRRAGVARVDGRGRNHLANGPFIQRRPDALGAIGHRGQLPLENANASFNRPSATRLTFSSGLRSEAVGLSVVT